jgi:hypothetical protein
MRTIVTSGFAVASEHDHVTPVQILCQPLAPSSILTTFVIATIITIASHFQTTTAVPCQHLRSPNIAGRH